MNNHLKLARPALAIACIISAAGMATPRNVFAQEVKDQTSAREVFRFSAFAEPVEIIELVKFVRDELGLQLIATDAGLQGRTIVMPTPIEIPRAEVLDFLAMILDLNDYMLTRQAAGVYVVQPRALGIARTGIDQFSTIRIINTRGIRPSSLQAAVQAVFAGGAPGQQQTIQVFDDAGVIMVQGSPQVTTQIARLVDELVDQLRAMQFSRIPVTHVAASTARDRVLDLLGARRVGAPGQQAQQPAAVGGSILALPDRLTVDPGSNALILRGRPDEIQDVRRVLEVVDVPTSLIARFYAVGTRTAEAVASEGQKQGLGDVTVFDPGLLDSAPRPATPQQAQLQQLQTSQIGGAGFTLYPDSGGFMYRGTTEQHARITQLVSELEALSADELIVYEFYKLRHGVATDMAALINEILGAQVAGQQRSPLVGGLQRGAQAQRTTGAQRTRTQEGAATGEGELGEIVVGDDITISADEPNNQLIVRAPRRLQAQFARLIEKLDLRRPQVYLDVHIVAISKSDDFRLAVEVQQVIGQFALNTNFGLGAIAGAANGAGNFLQPKDVVTNLPGFTSALVRSKDVPFIINALRRVSDAKVVARPQLLADDNSEAEVISENQQPTLTTSQGTATTQQSFGGFESAGPRLTVTPRISEGGYLRLEYAVELSSFIGDAISPGIPPARQVSRINSASVTIPSDQTIIVGGLTQTDTQTNVVKIPILGDIPFVGALFSDTRENKRDTTFYVFITPRILRDPAFLDLNLLGQGPLRESGLEEPFLNIEFQEIRLPDRPVRPAGTPVNSDPSVGAVRRDRSGN